MSKIFVVSLKYDIMFKDSDDGYCYAGEGKRLIKACTKESAAEDFIIEFNPVLEMAEQETTIFPVQKYNKIIKKNFGFVLNDIDQDGDNFRLVIEELEVE